MSSKDVDKQRAELAEKFPDGLFLLALSVENIMRISTAKAKFNTEGGLVIITGDNNQGKTSFLDAAWYALGGAATLPPDPIKEGEKRGKIQMTIGDKNKPEFIVTRNLWYGKRGELKQNIEVRPAKANSKPYDSPQTLLNALWNATSFDPLAFNKLSASEQRTQLLTIVGLDKDLVALQQEHDCSFEQRRDIKRDAKQIEGELARLDVPDSDTPKEEVSITDLSQQRELVYQRINERDEAKREVQVAINFTGLKAERVLQLETELTAAKELLTHADERLEVSKTKVADFPENLDSVLDNYAEQIKAAETTNEKVRAAINYNVTADRLTAKQTESQQKTDELQKIEDSKLKLLEDATFPIKDIGITDTGVTYQNLPLEQASHSDRLRISIALAMSMNPTLRLIISKEGNQLGKVRRELLDEMAKAGRFLVMAEMVSEDKDLGIYFEEGEIVEEEGDKPSE